MTWKLALQLAFAAWDRFRDSGTANEPAQRTESHTRELSDEEKGTPALKATGRVHRSQTR